MEQTPKPSQIKKVKDVAIPDALVEKIAKKKEALKSKKIILK